MTLCAPDDLPLDDLLKLENRLREIYVSQPPRTDGPAGTQVEDDGKPSSRHELNLALSSAQADVVVSQAVDQETVEMSNGVSQRLLSELEEFAACSIKAEPPSQSLASRLLSKLRPDR